MYSSVCTAKLYVGSALNTTHSRHVERVTIDPSTFFDTIKTIVSRSFQGATFSKARGLWEGVVEPTLVIDLINVGAGKDCGDFFEKARCLAHEITAELDQAAVMVVVRGSNGAAKVDFVSEGDLSEGQCRKMLTLARAG